MYCVKYGTELGWLRSRSYGSEDCWRKKNMEERKFPHGNFRQWVADIFQREFIGCPFYYSDIQIMLV